MPLFDFQCRTCEHVFEHTRPFGSISRPVCPSCGGKKTAKLLSPPAIHFRGQGFYKTAESSAIKPKEPETKTTHKKKASEGPSKSPDAASGSSSGDSPKE